MPVFRPFRPAFFGILCLVVLLILYLANNTYLSYFMGADNTTICNAKMKSNDSMPPLQNCSPVDQILFLKTHKTGSSTMTNIFFRYGDWRNLTFVLGPATHVGWPRLFTVSSFLPLYSEKPNILCSHARFNKKPMNWLFPKESSKYITILRNPVDNFESVFNYMGLGKRLGFKNNSLEVFLNKEALGEKTLSSPLVRNPMLYDLGLRFKFHQNLSAVSEYIQFLDKEFELVMIMDYFDESVLLMKRLLCWELDDILYLKLNERQDKDKEEDMNENLKENIRRWNKADVLLFDHFNKTFWRKIAMEGQSFYEELAVFRQKKEEIKRLCVTNDTNHLQRMYGSKLAKGYSIRADLPEGLKTYCEKLIIRENSYVAYLRQKRKAKLEGLVDTGSEEGDWNVAKDFVYKSVQNTIGSLSREAHRERHLE